MPEILTREELSTLFDACSNLRDKCLFMTAYGAGLRVSEAVCLKVCDIDSKNMQIFISKGKGSRDRFAILSEVNLEILREYWKTYRPRDYLFVNLYTRCGELAISTRAAQVAFKKTLERTNVSKNATFHTLRHCFATHLLENGVGVFQIKQLLGHVDIRSTMQYCHLVKISSLDVKSPLDRLSGIHG